MTTPPVAAMAKIQRVRDDIGGIVGGPTWDGTPGRTLLAKSQ